MQRLWGGTVSGTLEAHKGGQCDSEEQGMGGRIRRV